MGSFHEGLHHATSVRRHSSWTFFLAQRHLVGLFEGRLHSLGPLVLEISCLEAPFHRGGTARTPGPTHQQLGEGFRVQLQLVGPSIL